MTWVPTTDLIFMLLLWCSLKNRRVFWFRFYVCVFLFIHPASTHTYIVRYGRSHGEIKLSVFVFVRQTFFPSELHSQSQPCTPNQNSVAYNALALNNICALSPCGILFYWNWLVCLCSCMSHLIRVNAHMHTCANENLPKVFVVVTVCISSSSFSKIGVQF